MIDHLTPALLKALCEEWKTPHASFTLSRTADGVDWIASVMCVGRVYQGIGRTTKSAFGELAAKIIMDQPERDPSVSSSREH